MSTVKSSPLPFATSNHHPSHMPTLPPSPPLNHPATDDKQAQAPLLLLPSPSLSPPSSPASEDLSEAEPDFSRHAALFEALFSTPAQPGSKPIAPASLSVPPPSLPSNNNPSSPLPSTRKRKAESTLGSMDSKARDRVLRNRAAAQESRDKKRRYVTELECANVELRSENARLAKRLKTAEEEKDLLAARLHSLSTQLSQIQHHLGLSSVTQPLFDGFRDPAAVTNMAGLAKARGGDGAPNDRGNDDQHDGALPRVARGLASSQQRKPSSQQRTQLRKPGSGYNNNNNNNKTSSSSLLLPLRFPRLLISISTSTSARLSHEIFWPLAVWTMLSILFWITTVHWVPGRTWQPSPVLILSLSERHKTSPGHASGYLGPIIRNDWPP